VTCVPKTFLKINLTHGTVLVEININVSLLREDVH